MSLVRSWRLLAAAAVAAGATVASPAQAVTSTFSYNDGTTAYIQVTKLVEEFTDEAGGAVQTVMEAKCAFAIGPAVDDDSSFVALAGKVVVGPVAHGVLPGPAVPKNASAALATIVRCFATGEGVTREVSGAYPGSAAVAAGAPQVGYEGMTICVSARALLQTGKFIDIPPTCESADDGI